MRQLEKRWRTFVVIAVSVLLVMIGVIFVTIANIQASVLTYAEDCSMFVKDSNGTATPWNEVCPGNNASDFATTSNTAFAMSYRTAFLRTSAAVPRTKFPRVDPGSIQTDGELRSEPCITSNDSSLGGWADWQLLPDESGFSCYRMSKGANTLVRNLKHGVIENGNIDAVCYACFCGTRRTVATKTLRANLDKALLAEPDGESEDGFCAAFDNDKKVDLLWGFAAVLSIVIVNQIIKSAIQVTAHLMRDFNRMEQMRYTSTSIYLQQLLNTAIVPLMVRSKLPFFLDLPGTHTWVPNAKWFAAVATPLILTILAQLILCPLLHPGLRLAIGLKRWLFGKLAITQNQLNQSKEAFDFDLAGSYAEVLLACSMTFLFGPSCPILYFFAGIGLWSRFWIERFFVLRVYHRPPLYGKKLFELTDEHLSILVVMNSFVSLFFLGSLGASTTSSAEEGGLTTQSVGHWKLHPHVIPILLATIAVVLGVVAKLVVEKTSYFKDLFKMCSRDGLDELNVGEMAKINRTTLHVRGVGRFRPKTFEMATGKLLFVMQASVATFARCYSITS
eukprot:COSAG05_NODE_1107_length_5864_cov_7.682741_4_plen_561_part_00